MDSIFGDEDYGALLPEQILMKKYNINPSKKYCECDDYFTRESKNPKSKKNKKEKFSGNNRNLFSAYTEGSIDWNFILCFLLFIMLVIVLIRLMQVFNKLDKIEAMLLINTRQSYF